MVEVIPTILTQEPLDLEEKIKKLEGLVSRVQIDIIDGLFLPERSIGLETLEGIETNLKLDIHLMVKEPSSWIDRCVAALADRVIGQVEMMEEKQEFIEKAVGARMGVGLGLDLATEVKEIENYLPNLDLVLVMTRKAGFDGGVFEKRALGKVKYLKSLKIPSLEIAVDGRIDETNIRGCFEAGADLFCVGGVIWGAEDIKKEIDKLNNLINS